MIYEYGDKIVELLKVAEEKNKDVIDLLAQKVAENIENDKVIHTFGTGHSHMLGIELFARAGGLGNVDAMLDPDTLTSFGAQRSGAMEKTPGVSDVIYDSYNIDADRNGDALPEGRRLCRRFDQCRTVKESDLKTSVRQEII